MKYAIFALTMGALELAEKIKTGYPGADIYTTDSLKKQGIEAFEGKLSAFLPRIFSSYDVFIFIMATGIVVRLLAPLLKSKTVDPAVLVADEKGDFVISLVSGHIGGANKAAREVAAVIGARPVITTASDVTGTLAVDQLAMQYGLVIDNMEMAKQITALIVNRRPVFLKSDLPVPVPAALSGCKTEEAARGIIYLSNRKLPQREKPSVQLIPRTIIAGVGCRKGCAETKIVDALEKAASLAGRRVEGIGKIASCWVKKDEKGLLDASAALQAEIEFFSLPELQEVEGDFEVSEFVKKTIGVGAVAEPCAFLGARKEGQKLLGKTVFDEVTVALYEERTLNIKKER